MIERIKVNVKEKLGKQKWLRIKRKPKRRTEGKTFLEEPRN